MDLLCCILADTNEVGEDSTHLGHTAVSPSVWMVDFLSIKRMDDFLSTANTDIFMGSLCKHSRGCGNTLCNPMLVSPHISIRQNRLPADLEERETSLETSPTAGPSQAHLCLA